MFCKHSSTLLCVNCCFEHLLPHIMAQSACRNKHCRGATLRTAYARTTCIRHRQAMHACRTSRRTAAAACPRAHGNLWLQAEAKPYDFRGVHGASPSRQHLWSSVPRKAEAYEPAARRLPTRNASHTFEWFKPQVVQPSETRSWHTACGSLHLPGQGIYYITCEV